ncbi:MAG: hypothetical protein AAGU21_22275 [Solidesulfovibrio sp.]
MSNPFPRSLAALIGLLLTLSAPAARAADPAAVVFFTGNTYGTIAPCPS